MTNIKAIIKTDQKIKIKKVRPQGNNNIITVEPENKGKQHICIPYAEVSNIQEKDGLTTILINLETEILNKKATDNQGILKFTDKDFLKEFIIIPDE